MLHAVVTVDQILEVFQVRVQLAEFSAGQDPVIWVSSPITLSIPEQDTEKDPLSTLQSALRVWSESTNSD